MRRVIFPRLSFWLNTALLVFICVHHTSASLRPEIGTRALGLSGAFISSADDPTAVLWNPAGLASIQDRSLVYDLSQGAFSGAYPIDRIGVLGVGILDLNGADRFFINKPDNPIGTFELGNNQILLSYARLIGIWQFGGNLSYSRTPYKGSRWEPSYDLGVIAKVTPYLTVGTSVRDISDVTFSNGDGKILQRFEQQLAIGATWTPIRYLRLNSALDTASWWLRTGVEASVSGVSLRFGSILDFNEFNQSPQWSLGFSLNRWNKQIHYAYLIQADREHTHLLSIGFTFGRGQPIDEATHQPLIDQPQLPIANRNGNIFSARELAERYGIELELILAFIKVESSFQSDAVSGSGAGGLTQLMPPTARELGLKVPEYKNIRQPNLDPRIDERFHPRLNLEAGVKYLNAMLKRYDGNYVLAVAAYNAGPGNVQKNVPLIRETERHVGKVLNHYYQYKLDTVLRDADLQKLDALLVGGN
ncbi:lytic transglycosylase domain-containing protein [Candidatus Poribacteria bacterium]|nr:lytic transglycosylase domain-containing protein [Candidatus Poribacteria bacterium]